MCVGLLLFLTALLIAGPTSQAAPNLDGVTCAWSGASNGSILTPTVEVKPTLAEAKARCDALGGAICATITSQADGSYHLRGCGTPNPEPSNTSSCWTPVISGKAPGSNINSYGSNHASVASVEACQAKCQEFANCKAIIFNQGQQCTPLDRYYNGRYAQSTVGQQVANFRSDGVGDAQYGICADPSQESCPGIQSWMRYCPYPQPPEGCAECDCIQMIDKCGLGSTTAATVCLAPVDCVGAWGSWGLCSATCGGGTQARTYSVSVNAVNGGAACPAATGGTQQRTCNPEPCSPVPEPETYSTSNSWMR